MRSVCFFAWFILCQTLVVPDLLKNVPELMEYRVAAASLRLMLSLYDVFAGVLLNASLFLWRRTRARRGSFLLLLTPKGEVIPFGSLVAQILTGIGSAWLGFSLRGE